jgi:multidrug resistance efflux pump
VKGFVTEDDVHKARTSADAKTAEVDQAQSQLQLAKASLLSASAQKQQATAQISQSRAQIKESAHSALVLAPLLAQRESRASAVRLARYNYEQCNVVAPFDARVTNLTISEGQYAKAGQQLFTLIDKSTLVGAGKFQRNPNLTYSARNAGGRIPRVRCNRETPRHCRERELWGHTRPGCGGKIFRGIAGCAAHAQLGTSGVTIPGTRQNY